MHMRFISVTNLLLLALSGSTTARAEPPAASGSTILRSSARTHVLSSKTAVLAMLANAASTASLHLSATEVATISFKDSSHQVGSNAVMSSIQSLASPSGATSSTSQHQAGTRSLTPASHSELGIRSNASSTVYHPSPRTVTRTAQVTATVISKDGVVLTLQPSSTSAPSASSTSQPLMTTILTAVIKQSVTPKESPLQTRTTTVSVLRQVPPISTAPPTATTASRSQQQQQQPKVTTTITLRTTRTVCDSSSSSGPGSTVSSLPRLELSPGGRMVFIGAAHQKSVSILLMYIALLLLL